MKKVLFTLSFLIFLSVTAFAQVDQIVGRWKTIDDEDGTAKIYRVYFQSHKWQIYGKVEKLFKNADSLCTECEGAKKTNPNLV
jgi:hypothetical protein